MTGTDLTELVIQYEKHGWRLRRIVSTDTLGPDILREIEAFGDDIYVSLSVVDGAWFSRRSGERSETWELRRLGGSPLAMLARIEPHSDPGGIEKILREIEEKMSHKTKSVFSTDAKVSPTSA
ncbi:hypothetical protein [Leptolyngbya sp. 7M]|uniref:hypothetical protein n=1 Tax=Leptolyngbya sp. 7M TaxID=2812896 RepID=UPI001B8D7DB3|nr:hypothetical protein [Leptolyngbya sp. 7M]QYO67937.1 hypothetical protein JVX88_14845 [Leptolyngbya sp. 7M]